MNAILIDPFTESISTIDYSGDLKDIYRHLGIKTPFTILRLAADEFMYLDDEGLFAKNQRFFRINNYPTPLAGRGLIVSVDQEGNDQATLMTEEEVRALVKFCPPHLRFLGIKEETKVSQTPFGPGMIVTRTPLFGGEN